MTDLGTTTIADVVVQKIAGLATREVPSVHALGGGAARALGALRDRIPGASASAGQGVAVEVGEKQASVDLEIVVEYSVPIADLSRQVRRSAIERMTGWGPWRSTSASATCTSRVRTKNPPRAIGCGEGISGESAEGSYPE